MPDQNEEFHRQLITELRGLRRAVLTLAAAQLRSAHIVEEDSKAKDRVKELWKQVGYERDLVQ